MSELAEKVENFRTYLQERDNEWQNKLNKAVQERDEAKKKYDDAAKERDESRQERDETKQVFRDYISSVQSGGKISAELSARIAALGI